MKLNRDRLLNMATLKTTVAESAPGKAFNFLAICFLFSGATGLIYEVVWARMLGLVFGATTIAISAVLAAFMGGLALGSALAAKRISRITKPLRAQRNPTLLELIEVRLEKTAREVRSHPTPGQLEVGEAEDQVVAFIARNGHAS